MLGTVELRPMCSAHYRSLGRLGAACCRQRLVRGPMCSKPAGMPLGCLRGGCLALWAEIFGTSHLSGWVPSLSFLPSTCAVSFQAHAPDTSRGAQPPLAGCSFLLIPGSDTTRRRQHSLPLTPSSGFAGPVKRRLLGTWPQCTRRSIMPAAASARAGSSALRLCQKAHLIGIDC